jgi:phosphoserine phosphatase
MNDVLILISPHGLDDSTARTARDALHDAGIAADAPEWLAPGEACEIPVASPAGADDAVRAALGARPIDIVCLPRAGRRKRLLLADMDSTIVEGESLDELAAHAGVKDQVAALTAQAMNARVPYDESLRRRVALLAGLPVIAIDAVIAALVPTPGARTLLATMRAHGARTVLVTSGFAQFSAAVAARIGFDEQVSNHLDIADGKLTGRVREPILNREGKTATLRRAAAEQGLTLADALAVGDGANDLGMIEAAGLGVAFRAKPVVAARARAQIRHADLTAVLYLQGYKKTEFVAA